MQSTQRIMSLPRMFRCFVSKASSFLLPSRSSALSTRALLKLETPIQLKEVKRPDNVESMRINMIPRLRTPKKFVVLVPSIGILVREICTAQIAALGDRANPSVWCNCDRADCSSGRRTAFKEQGLVQEFSGGWQCRIVYRSPIQQA